MSDSFNSTTRRMKHISDIFAVSQGLTRVYNAMQLISLSALVGQCAGTYLSIAVLCKLLSKECVKSIPVRTGQVATYCP